MLGFTVEMGEGFEVRSDTDANDAAINGEQNLDPKHNNARARQHATEDAVDNMDVGTAAPLQMSSPQMAEGFELRDDGDYDADRSARRRSRRCARTAAERHCKYVAQEHFCCENVRV